MLINLIKSLCEQIDQEEYKENEKQSLIHILCAFQHSVNCKGKFFCRKFGHPKLLFVFASQANCSKPYTNYFYFVPLLDRKSIKQI